MLMSHSKKIDKFVVLLGVILVLLSVLVIFTFNRLFGSFITSREIDEAVVQPDLGINYNKVNEAWDKVYEAEILPLDLSK